MDYFGGLTSERGCAKLAVVDGNDRCVANYVLATRPDVVALQPALLHMQAILTPDSGRFCRIVTSMLDAGVRVLPVSTARLRLYQRLKTSDLRNEAHWLAHVCWLDADCAGPVGVRNSPTIAERMAMRAESVIAWF